MFRKLAMLVFSISALSIIVYGQSQQAGRYDNFAFTTSTPGPGGFPNVLAIPNATVSLCYSPATGLPCTNVVTTYTSQNMTTACPTNAQVVLSGTDTCTPRTDTQGNFGFWAPAGIYQYTLTVNNVSYGPYDVAIQQGGGINPGNPNRPLGYYINSNAVISPTPGVSTDSTGTKLFVSGGPVIDVQSPVFNNGARCNGVILNPSAGVFSLQAGYTVDTVALQQALNSAGSFTTPAIVPSIQNSGATYQTPGNAPQSTVRLPPNSVCVIDGPLSVPAGVNVEGNNSVIIQTNPTADVLDFPWQSSPTLSYGVYNGSVSNLYLIGGGATSTGGTCMNLQLANNIYVSHVTQTNCKFGQKLVQVQYSTFINVHSVYNYINTYLTALSTAKNLPTEDNKFFGGGSMNAVAYNVWEQSYYHNQWFGYNLDRGGVVDLLQGSQMLPYISSWAITNPGSGCTDGTYSATITDSGGTGSQGEARVVVSGGIVTEVDNLAAGKKWSTTAGNVTGTISASCSVAPILTATIQNDAGIGDWDGVPSNTIGGDTWMGSKMEGENIRPLSGFAMIRNANIVRYDHFYDINNFVSSTASMFYRLMENDGLSVTMPYPFPSNTGAPINDPLTGVACPIINTQDPGVSLLMSGSNGSAFNAMYWVCSNFTTPDPFSNYIGTDGTSGALTMSPVHWQSTNGATNAFTFHVGTESIDRLDLSYGGLFTASNGTSADVSYGRTGPGLYSISFLTSVATVAASGTLSGATPGTYIVNATGGGGIGAQISITALTSSTYSQPVLVSGGMGYTSIPTFTLPAGMGSGVSISSTLTSSGTFIVANGGFSIDHPSSISCVAGLDCNFGIIAQPGQSAQAFYNIGTSSSTGYAEGVTPNGSNMTWHLHDIQNNVNPFAHDPSTHTTSIGDGLGPVNIITNSTPTAGRAVCWKTATQQGYCSTQPDSSGSCTCN